MPPRSDQRLFEAHPPSTTPYTPREAMASTKRIPTFSSAAWRLIARSPIWRTSPNGMTANASRAGTTLTRGATMGSRWSTAAGVTYSLRRNLIGSATSVLISPRPAKPKIAARLAPMRSWMTALTFRSKNTPRPTTCRASRMAKTALAAAIATSTPKVRSRRAARSARAPAPRSGTRATRWCPPAGREPPRRRPLEGEASGGGAGRGAGAEAVLDGGLDRPRAAQRAGEVAAELEVPAALRLFPVHRIEGGHRGDPGERQVHQRGHVVHHRQRE